MRSRNQCLLDSLDGVPPLPSDSSVIIGPAETQAVRQQQRTQPRPGVVAALVRRFALYTVKEMLKRGAGHTGELAAANGADVRT